MHPAEQPLLEPPTSIQRKNRPSADRRARVPGILESDEDGHEDKADHDILETPKSVRARSVGTRSLLSHTPLHNTSAGGGGGGLFLSSRRPTIRSVLPASKRQRFSQLTPQVYRATPSRDWSAWHRLAFAKLKGGILNRTPESCAFVPAVTVDLSIGEFKKKKTTIHRGSTYDPSRLQDGGTNPLYRATTRALSFMDSLEDWVLVSLVAIGTAASAAWIEFVGDHLSDLRFGYCHGMPWLSRAFCCGSENAVDFIENTCCPATHVLNSGGIGLGHGIMKDTMMAYPNEAIGRSLEALRDPVLLQSSFSAHAPGHGSAWVSWSTLRVWRYLPLPGGKNLDVLMYLAVGTGLAVFGCALCLIFAPSAGGSGIPEVKTMLGGFSLDGSITTWTLVIKILSLALVVTSGLGLGKEGPMVHVGACWAAFWIKVTKFLRPSSNISPSRKNTLLSAGSAAGVSTAFGAPVGGVLFALEEVSTYFPPSTLYRTLLCAVVAAVFLRKVSPSGGANGTIFQMDAIAIQGRWAIIELLPFVIVGVIGGVVGALQIQCSGLIVDLRTRAKEGKYDAWLLGRLFKRISMRPMVETLSVALFASVVNLCHPMLRVSSIFLLGKLFTRCGKHGIGSQDVFNLCSQVQTTSPLSTADHPAISSRYIHNLSGGMIASLVGAFVFYFSNVIFTYGIMVPAGLFVPCLTIGALYGRLIGLVTLAVDNKWHFMPCQECIHPGVYSLLGAVACLAGTTRMTVSLIVIAMEMTGGLGYIVPVMLVTLVAKWTAEFLKEESIYDVAIRQKRLPFLHLQPLKSDFEVAYCNTASEVMTSEVVCFCLSQKWTLRWVNSLVTEFKYSHYPVVADLESKVLKGVINRTRLVQAIEQLGDMDESLEVCFVPPDEDDDLFKFPYIHFRTHSEAESTCAPMTQRVSSSAENCCPFLKEEDEEGLDSDDEGGKPTDDDDEDEDDEEHSSENEDVRPLLGARSILRKPGSVPVALRKNKGSRKLKEFIDLSYVVDPVIMQISPDSSLFQIHHIFLSLGISYLLFTEDGCLKGILTKKAFLSRMEKLRDSILHPVRPAAPSEPMDP